MGFAGTITLGHMAMVFLFACQLKTVETFSSGESSSYYEEFLFIIDPRGLYYKTLRIYFYGKVEVQYHKTNFSEKKENFFYCFKEKPLRRILLRKFSH